MPNDAVLNVRIPAALLAALDRRAKREGTRRAEVVRRALEDGLGEGEHAKALRSLAREVAALRAKMERANR